jgi:hypothetical protein
MHPLHVCVLGGMGGCGRVLLHAPPVFACKGVLGWGLRPDVACAPHVFASKRGVGVGSLELTTLLHLQPLLSLEPQ